MLYRLWRNGWKKWRVGLLAGMLMMTVGLGAHANILYVKTTGNNNNSGATWALAKRSVSAALTAAQGGDQIWVAAGSYVEQITLKANVALYGGFNGTETSTDQRDGKKNVTTLDGNQSGTAVTAQNCGPTTVIDSFTIRNAGYRAISCTAASPVISRNTVTGNSIGGISCYNGSSPLIDSNTIDSNTRTSGAGIYCDSSGPTIRFNYITNNSSSGQGAGIYCTNSNAVIYHNYIAGNQASSNDGGGIYGNSSSLTITNNILRGNNSGGSGGGIACDYQSSQGKTTISGNLIEYNSAKDAGGIRLYRNSADLHNNTIVYNSVSQLNSAAGIGVYTNSSPNLANNIIAFNTGIGILQSDPASAPQPANNCLYLNSAGNYSGLNSGPGDFDADPLFLNASALDFHLTASSPCVNKGDNLYVNAGDLDLDNNPRIRNATVDIGAYESPYAPTNATLYWRNGSSGDVTFWQLNGAALTNNGYLRTLPDLNWKMVASADLFHTGHTDLIWQNRSTGDIVYWDVNGSAIVSTGYIHTLADKNWTIVAAADLFQNGHTDLIWQNSVGGDVVYWDLNGATLVGSGYIKTLSDLNWKIVAAADLFHTGHTDLIWQNRANGDIVYWDLNGATLVGSGYIKTVSDLHWKIVGIADLFHTGHTDLIWQNSAGGDIVYWDLNGIAITSSGYINTISDLNWKIESVH